MTLGEKIIALRSNQKMSQGDLAEKLDVSRQSVSKWETEASVPELDKLIMMSELFHITLDELVKPDLVPEETSGITEEIKTTYVIQEKQRNPKHIAGFILLGAGLLGSILGFIFSEILLMIGLCLIIYGVICLVTKKYTGIVCGWFTTLLLCVPLYITGARSSVIGAEFNIVTIINLLFWIFAIVMIATTIKTIIKNKRSN